MLINVEKTHCTFFGFYSLNLRLPDIHYNNNKLIYLDAIRILGVWFDQRLTFSKHVSEIRKRLCYKLSVIRRAKSLLPIKIKLNLYYAHIHSLINYCFLVWGTTSLSHINSILVIQKATLRINYNVSYVYHSKTLFEQSKIIRIDKFYNYKLGLELKKLNPFFMTLFTLNNRISSYSFRMHDFYSIPRNRLCIGDTCLNTTVAKLLNLLHSNNIILFQLSWSELKSRLKVL